MARRKRATIIAERCVLDIGVICEAQYKPADRECNDKDGGLHILLLSMCR